MCNPHKYGEKPQTNQTVPFPASHDIINSIFSTRCAPSASARALSSAPKSKLRAWLFVYDYQRKDTDILSIRIQIERERYRYKRCLRYIQFGAVQAVARHKLMKNQFDANAVDVGGGGGVPSVRYMSMSVCVCLDDDPTDTTTVRDQKVPKSFQRF